MNQQPDGGGAGALGLLDSPFGSGGFPSITGGHAGPSNADAGNSIGVNFGNSFAVSGQGGSANSSPTSSQGGNSNMIILGLAALAALAFLRR